MLSESSLVVDSKGRKVTAGLLFWFSTWVTENRPAMRIFQLYFDSVPQEQDLKLISKNMKEIKICIALSVQG